MAGHLSYVRHLLAPELRAAVFPVQERWSGAALAGPRARAVLEDLLGAPAPGHMSALEGRLLGAAVRIVSASYSGERAFEVYASATRMGALFAALRAGVEAAGGGLYGLEALELLRIEKGHPEVGAEIDGRRSPFDLGLGRMLNPKGGFLGAAGLARPDLRAPGRAVLVGLEADGPIPEGAMLCASPDAAPEGHVSSAGRRLIEEGFFALGLLRGGGERHGEMVLARSPTRRLSRPVRVCSPHGYDPEGRRYHD
jgi:sarcosine oxidase subunit alpha